LLDSLLQETALCWAVGVEGQCDGEGELGGGGGPLPPPHMFKMAKTGNSSWWSRARARANF